MSSLTSPRRLVAEAFGTFLLTAAVISSIEGTLGIATPLTAALTLMVLVLLVGSVSGAHVNPAVTLGLFSIGKIKGREATYYILVQLLGGFVACVLLHTFFLAGKAAPLAATPALYGIAAELVGSFVFVFGVSTVVQRGFEELHAAVAVSFSLLLAITIAAIGSYGVLNPAVALGLQLFFPAAPEQAMLVDGTIRQSAVLANLAIYGLTPFVGAYLGAQLSRWMVRK